MGTYLGVALAEVEITGGHWSISVHIQRWWKQLRFDVVNVV